MIEQMALGRGHVITARVDIGTTDIDFSDMEVAIDFSTPDAALENISSCLEHGVAVISGTTGWLKDYDKVVDLCNKKNGAFIYASNFSLGVNIFFELNTYLAKMMHNLKEYKPALEEIHHTQKLDAPSGTAITLAQGIIENTDYRDWKLNNDGEKTIPISSKRVDAVPGTHTVSYHSEVDSIEIRHTAHNREGFALGAVIAAEWILGRTGIFSMKDVLNLG